MAIAALALSAGGLVAAGGTAHAATAQWRYVNLRGDSCAEAKIWYDAYGRPTAIGYWDRCLRRRGSHLGLEPRRDHRSVAFNTIVTSLTTGTR
jgi:hypothetical protein